MFLFQFRKHFSIRLRTAALIVFSVTEKHGITWHVTSRKNETAATRDMLVSKIRFF